MKGRPKKYRNAKRVLIFVDEDLLTEFDKLASNRSDAINKLIQTYVETKTGKKC